MSEEKDQICEIRKYLMNNHSVLLATFDMLSYNKANLEMDATVESPEFIEAINVTDHILNKIKMNIGYIDELLGWFEEEPRDECSEREY